MNKKNQHERLRRKKDSGWMGSPRLAGKSFDSVVTVVSSKEVLYKKK